MSTQAAEMVAELPVDEGPGQVLAQPFDGSVETLPRPTRVQDLTTLCKLRLNVLVLVTTAVGFHMASHSGLHPLALINTLIGTALTAACSAVLNQWMEIDRDRRMPRTRNRPLPAGRITPKAALALGIALGVAGLGWLAVTTNLLTVGLGVLTLATYLLLYTPLKPISTINTIAGAIPGALPPVMGYAAAGGTLGTEALALFAILFLWQMPHFLAIATLYREDYRAGGYVMLPVVDPELSATSRQTIVYTLALLPGSIAPTLFGMTGIVYAVLAFILGAAFLAFAIQFALFRTRKDARALFFASIIYLPVLLAVMVFDKL